MNYAEVLTMNSYRDPAYDAFLEHHGIMGMKWGIRRYQNPDGSLTDAGRKRYGDVLTKKEMKRYVKDFNDLNGTHYKVGDINFRKGGKLYNSKGKLIPDDVQIQRKPQEKTSTNNMKDMSDEELARAVRRLEIENDYIREQQRNAALTAKPKTRGQIFMDKLAEELPSAAAEVAKNAGKDFLQKKLTEYFKEPENQYEKAAKEAKYWQNQNDISKYKSEISKRNSGVESLDEEHDRLHKESDIATYKANIKRNASPSNDSNGDSKPADQSNDSKESKEPKNESRQNESSGDSKSNNTEKKATSTASTPNYTRPESDIGSNTASRDDRVETARVFRTAKRSGSRMLESMMSSNSASRDARATSAKAAREDGAKVLDSLLFHPSNSASRDARTYTADMYRGNGSLYLEDKKKR